METEKMNETGNPPAGPGASGLEGLATKASAIEDFIESHLVDGDGLLRCYLNADTLEPWTPEEFQRHNYTIHFHKVERGTAFGALAYEDSLMATAEFALGRIAKHECTGDALPLAAAARQAGAIQAVFREGEKFEAGYLPKPHGGLAKASWSHEISHDQYIKSILALRAFQPYAPASQKKAIDRQIVSAADYFIVRNFQYPRRECMVVTPETRAHTLALYIPLLVLAGKITGNPAYAEKLPRFDALLTALAGGSWVGDLDHLNANSSSLLVEGFHLALGEGHQDPRLATIIGKLWERHMALIGADGLSPEDSGQSYRSARVLRVAAFAPIVDTYFPGVAASKAAIKMLHALNDPRRMLCCLDSGVPTMDPFLHKAICELGLTSWLLAYWRLAGKGGGPKVH
jgi:hypothetical protein